MSSTPEATDAEFKPVVEIAKIIEELEEDFDRFLAAKASFDKEIQEKKDDATKALEAYKFKLLDNAPAIVAKYNNQYRDFIDKDFIKKNRKRDSNDKFKKFNRGTDYLYAHIDLDIKSGLFATPVYSKGTQVFFDSLKSRYFGEKSTDVETSLGRMITEFIGEQPPLRIHFKTTSSNLEYILSEQITRLQRLANIFIYEIEIEDFIFDYTTKIVDGDEYIGW